MAGTRRRMVKPKGNRVNPTKSVYKMRIKYFQPKHLPEASNHFSVKKLNSQPADRIRDPGRIAAVSFSRCVNWIYAISHD
jgi:hypothetical protein